MARPRFHRLVLGLSTGLSVLALGAGGAWSNPEDGVVRAGDATITATGNTLDIYQSSQKAVIDWRSFNIAPGETTEFHQPSSDAFTLNRVTSRGASQIDGMLKANGNIAIINQDGVYFGGGARVDVGGMVATSADIDDDDFMNGHLNFTGAGTPDAKIVNDGLITARDAGLVGLVAPNVENNGVIQARLGRVTLASGDTMVMDMAGDGFISVAVDENQVRTIGQTVKNTGAIAADGGTITMTAAAARTTVDSLIANTGVIQARSVGLKNGKIVLEAEGSNAVAGNVAQDKGKKSGHSTVVNSGVLDVSGRNAGERGGAVQVTGDNIALLDGTVIDASGRDGAADTTQGQAVSAKRTGAAGGDIQIGGDYLGGGTTATARNLYVDDGVLVLNDALNTGDAGRTIFWSDDTTQFYGNVYARALGGQIMDQETWRATSGGNAGNGGFVETSGHGHLDAGGYVDLTASNGLRGTYFLDPTNITIYGNVAPNFMSTDGAINLASSLRLWIDASDTANVNLTYNNLGTTATGTSGTNTITVSANTDLAVGARIRLGGAGAVTAAGTLGADTYTISAISGTTITLSSNLTANYTGSGVYQGYISQLTDKSGSGNNATQSTNDFMPLWISNGQNGLGTAQFDGDEDSLSAFTPSNIYSLFINYNMITGVGSDNRGLFSTYDGGNYNGNYYSPLNTSSYYYAYDGNAFVDAGVLGLTKSVGTDYIFSLISSGTDISGFTSGAVDFSVAGTTTHASNLTFGQSRFDEVYANALLPEAIIYDTAISNENRHLIEQYQSAKWGIGLTPPGSGATEAVKAMASTARGDATDGYSVFTTRYLERLSQTADISLQASNDITLDLKGDTLNLATAGRSLSLTAGNQITTDSAGTITTNNGAVSLTGTNGILLNHAFTINSGTAATTLTSINSPITLSGATTFGGDTTLNAGTGTITTASTVAAGAHDLTLTGDDLVLGGNVSGTGTLTLQPYSTNRTVNLNSGTADGTNFNLSMAEIARLVDGWSLINVGNTASSVDTIIGTSTWTDPLRVRTNSVVGMVAGASLAGTGNASLDIGGLFNMAGTISTQGQDISLSGGYASTFGGAGSDVTISTGGGDLHSNGFQITGNGGLNVATGGGDMFIRGIANQGGTAAQNVVIDAGTGMITFVANPTDGPYNVSLNAGAIDFAGLAWGDTTPLGNLSFTSLNSLILPSITASNILARTTGATADITVDAGRILTASGTGNALTLAAGRNFINASGASALSAASGRWLVYSADPADDTIGGLAYDFRRFSCTYGGSCPTLGTGDGLLYSVTPTLSATPTQIAVNDGNVPNLNGYGYSLSGYLDSDAGDDIVTGSLNGTTTFTQNATAGLYALDYATGSLASAMGYGFSYANNANGILAGAPPAPVPAASPVTVSNDDIIRILAQPVDRAEKTSESSIMLVQPGRDDTGPIPVFASMGNADFVYLIDGLLAIDPVLAEKLNISKDNLTRLKGVY